jgi:NAD(P)-dependent dehydrogenase (short-subunit alcohol dehydrogenase family)
MPTVLITGASTGIGRATALRLASNGWNVFAGVRKAAAGEQLAAEPTAQGRITPIQLDVTDAAQIADAAARIAGGEAQAAGGARIAGGEAQAAGGARIAGGEAQTGGGKAQRQVGAPGGALDALVNNAGVAVGGPLEMLPLAELHEQLDVNFFGQVAVTQALIPALRKARGRIVFLSSIGGRVTTPYMAPYHASKYAIEAVGNALRVELSRSHIQVALVEPGSVKTPIWDKGGELIDGVEVSEELRHLYGHVPEAMRKTLANTAKRGLPPERVAQTIERALTARRMRARYLIGADAHGMVWASRLLPDRVFDRVVRRAVGV